jgi:glycosyltransferase involved in cell wall biosynthesis
MRIVHVVATRAPASIQANERHVVYLAGTQRARGWNATVLTNSNGSFFNLCGQDGVPAFVVADLLTGGEVARGAGGVAEGIAVKLKEFNPEVIHCHDLLTAKAVVTAANRIKVPCVITLHEGNVDQLIYEFIAARRAGLRFTIIAVSKNGFEVMQENGMAGIDFHYVPNGTRALSRTGQQDRSSAREPNLMVVANLGYREGIDLPILAMVELRRRRGSACPVLNIYGAGDLGEYYIEMAKILDLHDIVKFYGIKVDILSSCPSSDVLIVPSRSEAVPLVILEAMSRGMPIVASDVGEIAEMLPDRRFGRVVPVNSIMVLADAMDSILTDVASGQFNPDFLVERHRSRYSIEKMADRVEAVYQSAIAGYPAASHVPSAPLLP